MARIKVEECEIVEKRLMNSTLEDIIYKLLIIKASEKETN